MVKRENVAPCYCAALRFRLVPGDARGLGRSCGRIDRVPLSSLSSASTHHRVERQSPLS